MKLPPKIKFCALDLGQPLDEVLTGSKYGKKCKYYSNGWCALTDRRCIVHEYVKVKK